MEADMFTILRRTLVTAVTVAAITAPSTASARPYVERSTTSAPAEGAVAYGQLGSGSGQGFQWDDAGIGAAGVLGLLGVAAVGSSGARRRRGASVAR
jgi:hypothetical protein